jgi:hypothetical protein
MFVVASEHASDIDLTKRSLRCYLEYNRAITNYLFYYKVLLTKLPNDIVKIIMSKLDPRNDVHAFGLCSGKIHRCKDYTVFNTCTKCFIKITQEI